jgi:hypothetical protein
MDSCLKAFRHSYHEARLPICLEAKLKESAIQKARIADHQRRGDPKSVAPIGATVPAPASPPVRQGFVFIQTLLPLC